MIPCAGALVRYWAKDNKIGFKTIKARVEAVDTAPSYREAFKKRPSSRVNSPGNNDEGILEPVEPVHFKRGAYDPNPELPLARSTRNDYAHLAPIVLRKSRSLQFRPLRKI